MHLPDAGHHAILKVEPFCKALKLAYKIIWSHRASYISRISDVHILVSTLIVFETESSQWIIVFHELRVWKLWNGLM
jgi:hypothetical protein